MEPVIKELDGVKYLQIDANTLAEIAYFDHDRPVLKTEVISTIEGVDDKGNPVINTEIKVKCFNLASKKT